MRIIYYRSEFHKKLRDFLFVNFPHRDKKYLDWWINQSIGLQEELSNRTFMVVDESEQVVACTTALWTRLRIRSKVSDIYWEANTIVNTCYRGKGIGRMIYERMNQYKNRCTIGFTETAYAIQPKIIENFKNLTSVYVYLSFNTYLLKSLWNRLIGRLKKIDCDWMFPEMIQLNHVSFEKIEDLQSFNFPKDGFWQNDEVELIRDKDFFKNRFVDIYRKYTIYQAKEKGATVGYFVIRPATYKGFSLMALVDFRFKNEKVEKSIMKAINIIARKNRIGMCITLTSLKKNFFSYDCTVRMPKVLYGGTTMAKLKEDDFMLITSADSDLDFVYYG